MKVAYLMGSLDRGGTENLLLDTLKHASQEKLDCLMIHRKSGSLLHEFHQTDIPIHYLPIRFPFFCCYFFKLRMILKKEKVQIVHAQLPFDAFLAYFSCIGTGVRLVLTFHGYNFGYNKFASQIVRFIIRRTDLNLYVSQHLLGHYISSYSLGILLHKQKTVYNGVDFNKFGVNNNKNIRLELGLNQKTLLFGSVGNFVPGRDQLTICRFLSELTRLKIDYYFVFVGAISESTPDLYNNCISFCAEHKILKQVSFLGSRNDVPAILHNLDAFVYSSDHDTFGIAVVEAIAAGIPVFVNDWEVMKEITQNGKLAMIYRTRDIDDLITKFCHFLQRQSFFQQQASGNAARVRQIYSIQKHIYTLKGHYQSIISTND
ncbi:glycosyltransferase family 4 protein [Larkinella punicea]|uniref:Glycosyltransferase n=1 Tax=Larkinella punicea TaxID=2315727 RepID=A0A368JK06_9BACT|nr:glycosyltransferase family 4 protein [Larkinella punicea]RCR67615.1 glycosyltransferase [Larkinella punicea]